MIYYLKHIDIEGPGTLGDFFADKGFVSKTIELYNGDTLPDNFDDMEMVVILGGPMNVDEEEKYYFLKAENDFIQELIKRDILTVGLCLGAQLIAKVAWARVYRAPVVELGFYDIFLTGLGRNDPLFSGVEGKAIFFQWHGDTFDVPECAFLLGKGANCPNQIFKLGMKVYGFQCHMEITLADALLWADSGIADLKTRQETKDCIEKEFELYQENLCQIAKKTYNNLLKLI